MVLTRTQNLCFEQKYEKYRSFSSEIFQILEVKFSIYLNRLVFVMYPQYIDNASFFSTIKPGRLAHTFDNVVIKLSNCSSFNDSSYEHDSNLMKGIRKFIVEASYIFLFSCQR